MLAFFLKINSIFVKINNNKIMAIFKKPDPKKPVVKTETKMRSDWSKGVSSPEFKKDSTEFVNAGKKVIMQNKMFPSHATTTEGKMFTNIASSNPDRKKAGYSTMEAITKMNKILSKNGNRQSFVDSVTVAKKKLK